MTSRSNHRASVKYFSAARKAAANVNALRGIRHDRTQFSHKPTLHQMQIVRALRLTYLMLHIQLPEFVDFSVTDYWGYCVNINKLVLGLPNTKESRDTYEMCKRVVMRETLKKADP